MRVSPDGNAHFARQENGQVFADGGKQKPGWFREWKQVYNRHLFMVEFCFALFLAHSNTQVDT